MSVNSDRCLIQRDMRDRFVLKWNQIGLKNNRSNITVTLTQMKFITLLFYLTHHIMRLKAYEATCMCNHHLKSD